jgi:hypothetical protein
MVSVKNNLAARRDGDGLSYTIVTNADGLPVITWLGAVTAYADEVLSADVHKKRGSSRQAECDEFLHELVANGPVPSERVETEGKKAGHSWRSLNRAKDRLGIKAHKAGFANGWVWQYPETQKGENL